MSGNEAALTPRRERRGSASGLPAPVTQPLLTPRQQLNLLPASASERLRLSNFEATTSGGPVVFDRPGLRRNQSVPVDISRGYDDESSHGDSTMEGSSEGLDNYVPSGNNTPERATAKKSKKMPSNMDEFLDQLIEDAQKPRSPYQSIRKRARERRARNSTRSLNSDLDRDDSPLEPLSPIPAVPKSTSGGKRSILDGFLTKNNENERPTDAQTASGETSVVSVTIDGQAKTFTVCGSEAKAIESLLLHSAHGNSSTPLPASNPHRNNKLGNFLDGRQHKPLGGDSMTVEGDQVTKNLRFQGKSTQELLDFIELEKRKERVRNSRPPVTVKNLNKKGLGEFLNTKSRPTRRGDAMTVEGDRVSHNQRFRGKSTKEFMDFFEAEKGKRRSYSASRSAGTPNNNPAPEYILNKRTRPRSNSVGDAVIGRDYSTSNSEDKQAGPQELLDLIEMEKRRIMRIAKQDDTPQQVFRRPSCESFTGAEEAANLVGLVDGIVKSEGNKSSRAEGLKSFFDQSPRDGQSGGATRSVVEDVGRSVDHEFTAPPMRRTSSAGRKRYSSPRTELRRMERRDWVNALSHQHIANGGSKSKRRRSLSGSRRSRLAQTQEHKRSQSFNFVSVATTNDQSMEQDNTVNTTKLAVKSPRRGRKPGVDKELEEPHGDASRRRRSSKKGRKKKAAALNLEDQEELAATELGKKSKRRSKSRGKKGKSPKRGRRKVIDIKQGNISNGESNESNTTENTSGKDDPIEIDRVTLKHLPRHKVTKSDDIQKPRSSSSISQDDEELDDKQVGLRFLLAERVRTLTNNAPPTPPESPNDNGKPLSDRITEQEKNEIVESRESTRRNKKKAKKRISKRSPKLLTPRNNTTTQINLDQGRSTSTPRFSSYGEKGPGNGPLELQLPFNADGVDAQDVETAGKHDTDMEELPSIPVRKVSHRPSDCKKKTATRTRNKLTPVPVKEGDVVAFDDDGGSIVSDITEGVLTASISSAEFGDSFRKKWEPAVGKITEADQLSKSDRTEEQSCPRSPRSKSLHLARRWQSAQEISPAAMSPKTPIREESERGKSPRFGWMKKKIPFGKKR